MEEIRVDDCQVVVSVNVIRVNPDGLPESVLRLFHQNRILTAEDVPLLIPTRSIVVVLVIDDNAFVIHFRLFSLRQQNCSQVVECASIIRPQPEIIQKAAKTFIFLKFFLGG